MLPGERVIASAMTDSPVADPSLQINIRSDEVLGILTDPSKRTKNASDDTIGAILAALSVFVMSAGLTFYVILRYRLKPIFQQSTVDKILKQEAVRYIAGLSEVFPVDSNILLTSSEITYVHLADLFLFNGINCNDDDKNKNKCVAGLRAILKVRYVAEESINIVRNNLELLGVKYLDADIVNLRENSFSLDDPKLRREIASLFLPS